MIPEIKRNTWKEIKHLDSPIKNDIENCLKEESLKSILSTVLVFFIILAIGKDGFSDGEILMGTVVLSGLLRWFFIENRFKKLINLPMINKIK